MQNRARRLRTGQPVWVVNVDGSRRQAEYIGESEARISAYSERRAFVIYAGAQEAHPVEIGRVLPQEAEPRRGAVAAEDAA